MRCVSVVLSTFISLGLAQAAFAADLPARYPTKAPAPYYAPVFSWTGFYIGGNVGWGWTDGDGTIAFGGPAGPFSGDGNGFLGGVQVGYNWQSGAFVAGLEFDFQGSGGEGDVTAAAGGTTMTGSLKTPWFGTMRGRLGYAMDRWLLYVTGGAVYGKAELDGVLSTTGAFSSSTNYWTWTLGAGVEAALWDRWSAKLEYLYISTPDDFPTPPGTSSLDGDTDTNIVRLGLNYRF